MEVKISMKIKVSDAVIKRTFDISDKLGAGTCIAAFFGQQVFSLTAFILSVMLFSFSLIGTQFIERRSENV